MRTKILGDTFSYEFDLSAKKDESLDSDYYIKIHPTLMTRSVYETVFQGITDGIKKTRSVAQIELEFELLRFDFIDEAIALSSISSILKHWSVEHVLESLDPEFLL